LFLEKAVENLLLSIWNARSTSFPHAFRRDTMPVQALARVRLREIAIDFLKVSIACEVYSNELLGAPKQRAAWHVRSEVDH